MRQASLQHKVPKEVSDVYLETGIVTNSSFELIFHASSFTINILMHMQTYYNGSIMYVLSSFIH